MPGSRSPGITEWRTCCNKRHSGPGVPTPGRRGRRPWNGRVPSLVVVRPLADARPIGAGQEGAEQGVSGVLLVETGAAPGAHGDRPVNVEVGRQWRPERPVVGQLDIGEDVGFHAVKACSGVRRVMIAPHYAMVQFFGILPVPVLNSRSVPYPERGISRCVLGGVRFV